MVAFLAFNGVLGVVEFMFGALFIGGAAALICGALQDIRRHLRRRILWLWAGATVIGFALLIAGLFGANPVSGTAVALAVGLWAAVGTAIAMAAYTREGREASAGIEAFRRFLLAGNAVSEAEYARYLPWAIALQVEEDWGARLAADLTRAGTPDTALTAEQRAIRYVHFGTGHPVNCGAVLSSALAAAAPTSSRNGGGGGCSGGGGGGGGW